MELTEDQQRAIWTEWHLLADNPPDLSPVKRIATRLSLPPTEVALVVFPPDEFGEWAPDQEPDLDLDPMALVQWRLDHQQERLGDQFEMLDALGEGQGVLIKRIKKLRKRNRELGTAIGALQFMFQQQRRRLDALEQRLPEKSS